MNRPSLTAYGLACAMAAPLTRADDAELLRCRALTDARVPTRGAGPRPGSHRHRST
jgi:hypothetical protein